MGIGAPYPGRGWPLRRGGELDDLFQRMHPGIGTSGTTDVDGLPCHGRQRRFHRGLDRRRQTRHRGLLLPAAEIPAIVGHAADPAMTRHIVHLPVGRLRFCTASRQHAPSPPGLCLPVACQIVVHRHSRGVSVRYSARTHHSPRPGPGAAPKTKLPPSSRRMRVAVEAPAVQGQPSDRRLSIRDRQAVRERAAAGRRHRR